MANMEVTQLTKKIAKFSASLYNEVAKVEADTNVVMSPLSVEVLLALLTLGAESHTYEELMKALDLPSDAFTRSSFKSLSELLINVKGVTLDIANKIYLKAGGKPLSQPFERDCIEVFDAGFESIDFLNGTLAAQTINSWVESKTNNRIKDLLQPGDFDDSTRLVLVNAIYFKGTWKKKFEEQLTQPRSFTTSKGAKVQVPTMSICSHFRYTFNRELKAQFLELPYEGGEMSMVFALPADVTGLPALQSKLAIDHNIQEIMAAMYPVKVDVKIPKFKIETTINLNAVLPKVGINRIFDERNSELTKLMEDRLFVSKAIQKAFIEVNEEGAEAAAATAMMMCRTTSVSAAPQIEIFNADRPFAFFLLHGDRVLFTGSIINSLIITKQEIHNLLKPDKSYYVVTF